MTESIAVIAAGVALGQFFFIVAKWTAKRTAFYFINQFYAANRWGWILPLLKRLS